MNQQQNHAHTGHEHHAHDCNGKPFQDLAIDALKQAKFRITKPRLAVIECLAHSKVPLSPKSIYESVKSRYDTQIDQVSVYRILETLTHLNLIHQVFPTADYLPCTTRCEQNPNHVMLSCTKCGKVYEVHLEWNYIYKIFESVKKNFNFEPNKQIFQIDGICAQCH